MPVINKCSLINIRNAIIAAALTLTLMDATADVDVDVQVDIPHYWKVFVSGNITKADATRFENIKEAWTKASPSLPRVVVEVNLNTGGGDLYAAMKIGRVLREIHASTIVPLDSICYSSCVLILAGSERRLVDGEVGIHRPYLPNAAVTTAANEKLKYAAIQKDIENFLASSNIDEKLYKDMLLVPPQNIKILSKLELDTYGLAQNDVYVDEAFAMNRAKKLGISRKEFAAREFTAQQLCKYTRNVDEKKAIDDYIDCKFRVERTGK